MHFLKITPALMPALSLTDWSQYLNIFNDPSEVFYSEVQQQLGVEYVSTFSSGRAGLYNILKANSISHKKVLMTSYSCSVVPEAIVQSGNMPIFIDIENNSFNTSNKAIEDEISNYGDDLGAVVITNLFGFSCSNDIKKIRQKANCLLILDNSLTPSDNSYEGCQQYDFDYIVVSCNVRKPLSCLGGGLVLTNIKKHHYSLNKYIIKTRIAINFAQKMKKVLLTFLYFVGFNKILYWVVYFVRTKTSILRGFLAPS